MPEKKHNFTKTEILAGLMVVCSVAVFIGFIAVIKGLRPPQETKTFYTQFTKTIGLKEGAKVKWGGFEMGQVINMKPSEKDQTQILICVAINPDVPVNEDSVATIEQASLTSEKHLEISTGSSDAKRLPADAFIQSKTLSGALIDMPDISVVVGQVEELLEDIILFLGVNEAEELEAQGTQDFAKVSRIAGDIRTALNEGTSLLGDVRTLIEEERPKIASILEKVTEIEDSANGLVGEVSALIEENRPGIASSVESLEAAMDDIQGLVSTIETRLTVLINSLEGTLNNIESLSGEAEEFLDTNRPALDDVVQDLRLTIRHLKSFSDTLAKQPQSLIRGKAVEGRK